MASTAVWQSIMTTLRAEIGAGLYAPGTRLPTEAALAARFGVNRHTVRRALSDLSDRGIVRSRRGAGVFVEAAPTEYPLGRRVRFHRNLTDAGRLPERRILRIETRPAQVEEAEALRLAPGDPVVICEGISLSDGTPIAIFESVFPDGRLPGLADALRAVPSVTDALRRAGVRDYIRAETRITAVRASVTQALHLGISERDPLLCTISRNDDLDGLPVERGRTWFAGDRVALTYAAGADGAP